MSIANKIIFLILLLFGALAANTWFGLSQMGHIRLEFAAMTGHDMVLTEAVTSIHHMQLRKNILLQKIIGIAEEMGFEKTSFARNSYLHDQLKVIGEGLAKYSEQGFRETARARRAAQGALDVADDPEQRSKLQNMLAGLGRLEQSRKDYDATIGQMLIAVKAGGFQLSLEDLEHIQLQENELSKDVEVLLKNVQGFAHDVLTRTGEWEAQAYRVLIWTLSVTMVVGLLLAFWIVRSITRPLKSLSHAAVQVGSGNFKAQLPTTSNDELAELSRVFNTMSAQLEEFKLRQEWQNTDLKNVNEEIDKYIHVMGEHIVNPLTMMIAYCTYVEQHGGQSLDPKSLESLQGIRRASIKMHAMVKDLLQFAKSKRPSV